MDRTLIKKYIDNQPQKVVAKLDLNKNKIEYQGILQGQVIKEIKGDLSLIHISVCSLRHICQLTEYRTYLVGSVHIHSGSKESLQRVNDNQSCIVFFDRIFNAPIR